MDTATTLFEVERQGDTLILTVQRNLRELEYQEIEVEEKELVHRMASDPSLKNVVVDFDSTDYFGSTALGLFTRLWQQVRERNGRLIFCNVSAHEDEILAVTGLRRFWPIYPSRAKALEAVSG